MSLFSQYLAESKKQYAFRIKLACECSKEQMAKLKEVMDKYDVAAISEPKVTPIAETHTGFEHLKNVSLSICKSIMLSDTPKKCITKHY